MARGGSRQEHANTFSKGMNKDISKTTMANTMYRHAENLRITNLEGEGNGALVNIKGTELKLSLGTTRKILQFKKSSGPFFSPDFRADNHYVSVKLEGDATWYSVQVPAGTVGIGEDDTVYLNKLVDLLNTSATLEDFVQTSNTMAGEGFRFYVGNDGNRLEVYNDNAVLEFAYIHTAASKVSPTTKRTASTLVGPGKGYRIIGSTLLRDDIIVFAAVPGSTTAGEIWKLIPDHSTGDITKEVIYDRPLGLNINYPVEAVARYETNKTQRVYWTDNNNNVRSLNIAAEDPNNIDSSLLDLSPAVTFDQVRIIDYLSSGSLPVGVYQYCYRLKKSGTVSRFTPISDPIPVLLGSIGTTFWDESESTEFVGKDIGASSGKALSLEISDLDLDYDTIEVAYFYHSAAGVDPVAALLLEQDIPTNGILQFIHSGAESVTSIGIDEILRFSSSFTKAKTIAVKDNRLFAGNVQTSGVSDLKMNARAYRFKNNSGGAKITYVKECMSSATADPTDPISYDTPLGSLTDPNLAVNKHEDDLTDPVDINAINWYNNNVHAELDDHAFAYQTNGKTLGGSGQYIDYKFIMEDIDHSAAAVSGFDISGQPKDYTQTLSNIELTTSTGNTHKDTSTWNNFKGPVHNSVLKGYQRGEVYRFGIVLFDKKGRPGYVNWIGDIKFPQNIDSDNKNPLNPFAIDKDERGYAFCSPHAQESNTMRTLGIEFSVTIPSDIEDEVSSYQIVRMRRSGKDKTILGTGMGQPLSHYSFNLYRDTAERVNDDSSAMWSGDTQDFYALGINGERWGGSKTDGQTITYEGGGITHDRRLLRVIEQSNLGTFDCPDFQFLGAPTFAEGDSLRFVGMGRYKTGNDVDHAVSDAWNRNGQYGSYGAGEIFPVTSKWKFPAAAVDCINLPEDAPETGGPIKLYHCWQMDLDIYSGTTPTYTTLSSRTFELEEGTEVAAGSHTAEVDGKQFKNYFVGPAVVLGKQGTGSTIPETQERLSITGEGNKTFAVKTKSALTEWINGGGYGMTRPSFKYDLLITNGGSNTISSLKATYQVTAGFNGNNGEYGITDFPIFQYVRQVANQYGGNSAAARKGNIYIPCSDVIEHSTGSSAKVNVFRGDTYVAMYANTKSEKRADDQGSKIGYIFPVETSVNINYRDGANYMTNDYSSYNRTPDDFLVDSVLLFSRDITVQSYISSLGTEAEVNEFDNRVYASNEKINGETEDSWRAFGEVNFIDVEGLHGPINKLSSFKDDIYYLQDSGVGRLSINPRAMITAGGVGELQLGEGGVLDDFSYISTEFGCQQQFANVVSDKGFYFVDARNKKLFMLGGTGVTPISVAAGMNSYFQGDLGSSYFYDNPFIGKGITAVWDKRYNEIMFTLNKGAMVEISGVTRSGNNITLPSAAEIIKFHVGEVIEVVGSLKSAMAEIASLDYATGIITLAGSGELAGIGTTSAIKYSEKEEIYDIFVEGASGAITTVDTRITSALRVGDIVKIVSSEEGDVYVKVTDIVRSSLGVATTFEHNGGWISGDLSLYGYISKSETLVISEDLQTFTGFYSFGPNTYITNYNFLWSFNPYNTSELFLHDASHYGLFYGGYYDSLLDILVNASPMQTKAFDNVNFQLESYNSNGLQQNSAIDQIRFTTDYQNSDWLTLDPASGSADRNLRRAEREWQLQIPRNAVVDPNVDIFESSNIDTTAKFKDRIRDKYMNINMKIQNGSSNIKKMLHYVSTIFRTSKR